MQDPTCHWLFQCFGLGAQGQKEAGERVKGASQPQLTLLHDITGAFRPKRLTCLMGVSGAGKTTLMDVLAGRKTGSIPEPLHCSPWMKHV